MLRTRLAPKDTDLEPLENAGKVSGFKSPAEDYSEERLSLHDLIVTDPVNTYFFRYDSGDMLVFGIQTNAILVVDTSIRPTGGRFVVVWFDGKWNCRQFIQHGPKIYFTNCQEGDMVEYNQDEGMRMFGTVTWFLNPADDRVSRL